MFSSKKTSEPTSAAPSRASSNSGNGTTLISKDTTVTGDISFAGSLVIEGRVEGNIFAEDGTGATMKILDSGSVAGEIRVPSIVINGSVVGDVFAAEHIELAAKAVVDGNVHYKLIEMVKGAQVNGNLLFRQEMPASKPKTAELRTPKEDPVTPLKTGDSAPAKA
jgi:cytoskeletal protein CcmA (bactofilin family)